MEAVNPSSSASLAASLYIQPGMTGGGRGNGAWSGASADGRGQPCEKAPRGESQGRPGMDRNGSGWIRMDQDQDGSGWMNETAWVRRRLLSRHQLPSPPRPPPPFQISLGLGLTAWRPAHTTGRSQHRSRGILQTVEMAAANCCGRRRDPPASTRLHRSTAPPPNNILHSPRYVLLLLLLHPPPALCLPADSAQATCKHANLVPPPSRPPACQTAVDKNNTGPTPPVCYSLSLPLPFPLPLPPSLRSSRHVPLWSSPVFASGKEANLAPLSLLPRAAGLSSAAHGANLRQILRCHARCPTLGPAWTLWTLPRPFACLFHASSWPCPPLASAATTTTTTTNLPISTCTRSSRTLRNNLVSRSRADVSHFLRLPIHRALPAPKQAAALSPAPAAFFSIYCVACSPCYCPREAHPDHPDHLGEIAAPSRMAPDDRPSWSDKSDVTLQSQTSTMPATQALCHGQTPFTSDSWQTNTRVSLAIIRPSVLPRVSLHRHQPFLALSAPLVG
ncbi:hypothetical protein BS50DRAFT_314746 [Corynespora cassiicola Philippines]|uniref:Uncharacterized protein n=1 Tax=Corynespora cassiicola Philippines TaxID=1448308 RepID=A0A2T2NYH5_CORCC|nr:hypothetical protein BS50DRAFT_314746 [Corynespora cassiicola Philippines]